ncbi:tail fiber domain-containing protein [Chryseobacterium sp. MYb264]|uniref:tail fiber domain-containing protein n=1 Tax=Chryseobacterium sp. MYb264 TaxID=2745153 RepID=UPI002E167AF4|nr:tail fiber domain-containing protein [Chryseobacterium sp. MYb264]
MVNTDYYVSYNGTANSTFTLPAAITGVGNFKGRLYTIKNNTSFTVTVNPAGAETINGNSTISLSANQSVQIINTGLTGAASTWEVLGYNSTSSTGAGCIPDYIFATINGIQSGVQSNTNINFNLVKAGTGIALTGGVFTLKAGKTYELEGHLLGVNFSSSTAGVISASWVDTATNTSLAGSTTAEFYPVTYTVTNNSEMPMSKAVITPSADINVAFRVSGSTGTADMRGNQSYAIIKQLNACGGGGGNTTIVNSDVTASNGLTASSNNVKLGGTLSEVTTITNAGNNLNIMGAGSVGIGTATPSAKLDVLGVLGVQFGSFPNASNMSAVGWNAIQPGIGENEYVNYRGTGTGGFRFFTLTSGTPVIGNSIAFLDANGAWTATSFNPTSDARLKRNIKNVEHGLDTILKLHPVSYEKKTNLASTEYNTKEIGFVAQEIRQVLPDIVKEADDSNKLLSVNYDSLIPVLTKAVQELNAKVDELNSKLQKLESENSQLKNQK